jgi:type III secretory pathway component EscU
MHNFGKFFSGADMYKICKTITGVLLSSALLIFIQQRAGSTKSTLPNCQKTGT